MLPQVIEALSRFGDGSVAVTGMSVTHEPYNGRSSVTLDLALYGHADAESVVESMGFGAGTGWIDASKQKPKSDDVVLVCRGQDVSTSQYWGRKYGWSVSPSPTHWMPMPKPAGD